MARGVLELLPLSQRSQKALDPHGERRARVKFRHGVAQVTQFGGHFLFGVTQKVVVTLIEEMQGDVGSQMRLAVSPCRRFDEKCGPERVIVPARRPVMLNSTPCEATPRTQHDIGAELLQGEVTVNGDCCSPSAALRAHGGDH